MHFCQSEPRTWSRLSFSLRRQYTLNNPKLRTLESLKYFMEIKGFTYYYKPEFDIYASKT